MIHSLGLLCLMFVLLVGLITPSDAGLDAYLKRPEPAYHWQWRGEKAVAGGTIYELHLVSQVWQGIPWEHRVQIFRPAHLVYPGFCALLNTGGSGSAGEEAEGMRMAEATGTTFAILYNIPNQPLYGGKTEDALIVYTWLKYLETGDETWPLHFPMAKSVLKAMDAIQAFTRARKQPPITGFLITGASKRGWTTWLAGASRDPRIRAIAPMVIDTLNLPAQIPHQLAAFGKPSEEVEDYTRAGLLSKLSTPAGQRLVALEDPYSYRDRLTLPKLLVLGTNDRYWAQDALNLYWNGLRGPKWVLYDPNSGHALEDRARVFRTLTAFIRASAGRQKWPKMAWTYTEGPEGVRLLLKSDIAPRSAELFQAHAATQDLRDSHWSSAPMTRDQGGYAGRLSPPAEGYTALFGEATYDLGGQSFTLSTQIKVLHPKQ